MLVATVLFEWHLLRSVSPLTALSSTHQVAPMEVRGGTIYVQPYQYYLTRGTQILGAVMFLGAFLVSLVTDNSIQKTSDDV